MTPMQEVASIQDVPMEVLVELDRPILTLREILELQQGSVIQTDRSAGENIDVYVGKKIVACGEIVIIENSMGVRITDFRVET